MPAANVIQLRTLLAEKFPGLRMNLAAPRPENEKVQASGLPQIDRLLRGGFPRGALSEIVAPQSNCGSAALLGALLEHVAGERKIAALIDGNDSFNPATTDAGVLGRLLWVRCRTVTDAVKAADLVLRDANLPLVLLDLTLNAESQLRKIPASTWYRFQRLAEDTGSICIVFTPRRLLARPRTRISLVSQFSLPALEADAAEIHLKLRAKPADARSDTEPEFPQIHA